MSQLILFDILYYPTSLDDYIIKFMISSIHVV